MHNNRVSGYQGNKDHIDNMDYMNLGQIKIQWGNDKRLWISESGSSIPVSISCCFPWSNPFRYISLRDDNEEEVALISDLSNLDSESRDVLKEALKQTGFVFEITSIMEIEQDFEIRSWHVNTRQGSRKFQTRLDEWPYEVPGGGLLIKDLAGDLYYVEDPDKMDKQSRRLFWTVSG